MESLPDPTLDLKWSDYPGAIHEIFARNAAKHPQRVCVVETENPPRSYTYQQINEASNLLAHHLLQSGILKDEVVMIYSYRGVDLVVAIMGTLKSGATFSVLDPAYPPDRQEIYLDVARPRALITIERATEEAGPISEKVRAFISEKLELRTEIPGLKLSSDGSLRGGTLNNRDALEQQLSLKSVVPDVIVGPDSTPTLSFTSGSEGRPKGVCGRHYSLAYYFPWMSKRFNLSENDRFTMLSGIAHDPIQRDIFTPLFLGAQLLIPAVDDIQHERLAEWMKKHAATVTHLTPAMGQILVGEASAEFPSLHHAFFVGDILIKRDCRALQRLAPNVNIVNMYGTTETQRAVSFYEIPSWNQDPTYLDGLKEVIPAGRGMDNVQLLVVDRNDRTKLCKMGEIGEIYVRAAGLAEKYLGSPDLTAEKFVSNWFVDPKTWVEEDNKRVKALCSPEAWREHYLGPRDRMYRSGDLGQYTRSGDVECSGRADDQVKIRGFRIELGEINAHLSAHPLVRENITLVRRDKFEEPTLVSYYVPDLNKWRHWAADRRLKDDTSEEGMVGRLRRFRALGEDARGFLKTKLAAYAIPTYFIPMISMPLNPNGKIDKPKLPFPDIAELEASAIRRPSASHAGRSETEHALAAIWAKWIPSVISAKTVGSNDSFFDLGGNSISAQSMLRGVRARWRGIEIPMSTIFRSPTLKAFAAEIDRALDPGDFRANTNGTDQNGTESSAPNSFGGLAYAQEAITLADLLPSSFSSSTSGVPVGTNTMLTVLVTGATGFLGAYILQNLLNRESPSVKVVAHVRAKDQTEGFSRIKKTCEAYGVWSSSWPAKLECVTGDLAKPKLGIESTAWDRLSSDVDVVIHNGAIVHWVYPYSNLRGANVLGTISALELCATGKPKNFAFVSSTSVLDTDHYVGLSEKLLKEENHGILESDDLQGSSTRLGNGYGQSKWVAEYLVREAGRRGLKGSIIRPGYVTGDSKEGVTNTDDFLVRMIKGCLQLNCRPNITNTINMVPVDHVARVVVASAFSPIVPLSVAHVTGHPRMRMNDFLASAENYGYNMPQVEYEKWRLSLFKYVEKSEESKEEAHALMPLYHFVTSDLPSSTKAPELDDTNTATSLRADAKWSGVDASGGVGMTERLVQVYLDFLVEIGFLPATEKSTRSVHGSLRREALKNIGGRGVLT